MDNIKISVVNFLNSLPFAYALKKYQQQYQYQLSHDVPSICAQKLIERKVNLGLVPTAILANNNFEIIGDYCIGATNNVRSVVIWHKKPLREIQSIKLDKNSRTSNALTRILAKEVWGINPDWISYNKNTSLIDAQVQIGDDVFSNPVNFEYCTDLSKEWNNYTGLPFVFACWVSNIPIQEKTRDQFNSILKAGLQAIDEIVYAESEKYDFDMETYFKSNIEYIFDEEKRKGMALFLEKLQNL